MSQYKQVSVMTVFNLFSESGFIYLVDVREEDEYAECSATLSKNMPLSSLNAEQLRSVLPIDSREPIYLICRSGKRSLAACRIFAEAGFENVYNVIDGMQAWKARQLPLRCS